MSHNTPIDQLGDVIAVMGVEVMGMSMAIFALYFTTRGIIVTRAEGIFFGPIDLLETISTGFFGTLNPDKTWTKPEHIQSSPQEILERNDDNFIIEYSDMELIAVKLRGGLGMPTITITTNQNTQYQYIFIPKFFKPLSDMLANLIPEKLQVALR